MGITLRDVRPDDAEALGHVLVTANNHIFKGIVPKQCLQFTEEESTANWHQFFARGFPPDDHMIVAETDDGQLVGYAWAGPNTEHAGFNSQLRQISVLPDFQGQGIGRTMVCHLATWLAEQGINNMCVEVIKSNPNRAFYERLGAEYVSEHPYNWDGIIMQECVYGWQSLNVINHV